MNKKEFNIAVSVKDNNAKVINGVIQYDTGNLFNINILDGTAPFDFTGYSNVIIEVLKPDGTVYVDGNGGYLDVIDAADGLVAFTLQPQCALVKGMHFVALSIFSNGTKVTTARFNYYVSESMDEGQGDDILSKSEYPILQQLIAQNSNIIESEQMRIVAEQLRQMAEASRVSETSGILAQAKKAIEQAQSYVNNVKNWYDLFMSAASDIGEVDLSSVVTKTNLDEALRLIDCGEFIGTENKTVKIQRGLSENMPVLSDGELGYAKDDKRMFIGTEDGNFEINSPCYIVQATAPEDTTVLWIDTANGNALKYWNGTAWLGTSTAVFA
ncbi:hypothetical protein M2140_001930 [Clostridiales Family XIII bacterium PM5-7]